MVANHPINEMSEEYYRKYIKFMADEITDITDLKQMFVIARRKFINSGGTRTPEPVNEK